MKNLLKKTRILLYVGIFQFGVILLPIDVVFSQENSNTSISEEKTTIKDVEGLRAELTQMSQDPESKYIRFELKLTSSIYSERVKVTWNVTGQSIFVNQDEKVRDFVVEENKTYVIPVTILPTGISAATAKTQPYAATEILATVESFGAGATFVVTARKNFASNIDGEYITVVNGKIGLPQEYTNAKNLIFFRNLGIVLLVVTIGLFGGYRFLKGFLKWLNRNERLEYDSRIEKLN